MVIVGSSILQRTDGASIFDLVFSLANKLKTSEQVPSDWRVLNVMHRVSYWQVSDFQVDVFEMFLRCFGRAALFYPAVRAA